MTKINNTITKILKMFNFIIHILKIKLLLNSLNLLKLFVKKIHKQMTFFILMSTLSDNERLNLQKMINDSECEDNTTQIRELKHSILLRDNIRKLDTYKKQNRLLKEANYLEYIDKAKVESPFLFNSYTDIFNRIMKDELDLEIMTKLLIVLKMIEDGINQHEGSVMVGKVLKELYVDSALKRGDNIDDDLDVNAASTANEGKKISWKEYKQMNM